MAKKTVPVAELSYEQALEEIKNILDALDNETQDLDTTMSLYERGRTLIKHCQGLLDEAELKVKTLGDDGRVREPGENA